jgi:hypothetical protein
MSERIQGVNAGDRFIEPVKRINKRTRGGFIRPFLMN